MPELVKISSVLLQSLPVGMSNPCHFATSLRSGGWLNMCTGGYKKYVLDAKVALAHSTDYRSMIDA